MNLAHSQLRLAFPICFLIKQYEPRKVFMQPEEIQPIFEEDDLDISEDEEDDISDFDLFE